MTGENRELRFADQLLVDAMRTGNEVHMVVTKGLIEEGGRRPSIIGASYDERRQQVVLEFDRPVPENLMFMNVPPL